MLVYVPQFFVVLVYVGAELHDVLEAGVSCVAPVEGITLHYVDLHAAALEQGAVALEAMH